MASSINASTSGAGGLITTADNTGILQLQSAGTTVATVNSYGIGLGTGVPSSGIGITFPATQSASSDANTLDDYEEGTFTAAVKGSSTAGTYTITSQTSVYTKIGRLVSLSISISGFSTASGGGGYMQITGLPFANINAARGLVSGNYLDFSVNTLFAVSSFVSSSGVTTLYLEEIKDNAIFGDFQIGGISTSSSNIGITITYATS